MVGIDFKAMGVLWLYRQYIASVILVTFSVKTVVGIDFQCEGIDIILQTIANNLLILALASQVIKIYFFLF